MKMKIKGKKKKGKEKKQPKKKGTKKAAPPARKKKAPMPKNKDTKIVYFNVDTVDEMKRKRLQSLAKRIGLKANGTSASLKEQLKEYYEKNKDGIESLKKSMDDKKKNSEQEKDKKIRKRQIWLLN